MGVRHFILCVVFVLAGAMGHVMSAVNPYLVLIYDWQGNARDGRGNSPTEDEIKTRKWKYILYPETLKSRVPEFICGLYCCFSVSANTTVEFSPGNLQYRASTNTWRFAEHQWEYVGDSSCGNVYLPDGTKCNNALISDTYDGWIDLFGWGTGKDPTKHVGNAYDYRNYKEWGDNPIINGGDEPYLWRTLSSVEWQYVVHRRNNSRNLCGLGIVAGVKGLILLPDAWSTPTGVSFSPNLYNYTANNYSEADWSLMEAYGAVFLPASGYRSNNEATDSVTWVNCGDILYWSNTQYSSTSNDANALFWSSQNQIGFTWKTLSMGVSVRLVRFR